MRPKIIVGIFAVLAAASAAEPGGGTIRFEDVTAASGIQFTHSFGAERLGTLVESTGAGCVWFDYNHDGKPDLFVVSGRPLGKEMHPFPLRHPPATPPHNHLYRNDGNGHFTDVTDQAGVAGDGFSFSAIAADFDNDGLTDVLVTSYGRVTLYRNKGDGAFEDTFLAGIGFFALAAAQSATLPAPRYPSPDDLAISPDGARLYAVCSQTNELAIIDLKSKSVISRIPVGRVPRGVTISRDGGRVYVVNSWSDNVSEIDPAAGRVLRTLPAGFEPVGAALDNHGFLYVANRLSNDVSLIDLKSGADIRRLQAGRGASWMTASADGSRIFITHIYPNDIGAANVRKRFVAGQVAPLPDGRGSDTLPAFRSPPESEITEIDTARQIVADRHPLHNVAGVFHVALTPDGRLGIAAQIRPKNLIPLAHVEHGWVFGNSLAVFGEAVGAVVQLPLDEIESFFSLPFGVAIAPDASRVYISASGSDEVAVLDLRRLLAAAHSPSAASLANDLSASARYVTARIPVGHNPRTVVLSPDGATLYVANRLDDTISVIDTARAAVTGSISLGAPASLTPERRGERLFYSSKFSFGNHFGCANCHLDSTFDKLSWDLEPDGFGMDILDNRALEEIGDTAPYKWNGSSPDLQTECGPRTERFFFRSQGFHGDDLEDLVHYVKSIPLRPNRFRLPKGELTPAQERGQAIFERTKRKNGTPIPDELQCFVCHSGPYYTNLQMADVGTGKPTDRSPRLDIPQLTNIVYSAPYLHDGSAKTLEEIWTVFNPDDRHGVTNDLTKDELNDLIEYLKTL